MKDMTRGEALTLVANLTGCGREEIERVVLVTHFKDSTIAVAGSFESPQAATAVLALAIAELTGVISGLSSRPRPQRN